jgi:hypothetical protein
LGDIYTGIDSSKQVPDKELVNQVRQSLLKQPEVLNKKGKSRRMQKARNSDFSASSSEYDDILHKPGVQPIFMYVYLGEKLGCQILQSTTDKDPKQIATEFQ